MVTQQEARDMWAAIRQFQEMDSDAADAARQILRDAALVWWDGIKPAVPTTRDEALAVFQFIENLLTTETDLVRLELLRKKLREANEKYRDIKRNG